MVQASRTLFSDIPSAALQPLRLGWLDRAGVELAILRLDQVDPLLSGNKWYKLAHHLAAARAADAKGLISLGGPHSNHLHALAAAGQRFGLPTVGLLRGEPQATATVQDLQRFGMTLHWLGYGGYRDRHRADFFEAWRIRYPDYHCIPEGGGGLPGALGCATLPAMVEAQLPGLGWPDHQGWWLAAGTGTTLAGIVIGEAGMSGRPVFGALAGPVSHRVTDTVRQLLDEAGIRAPAYQLIDASRGGFARFDADLAHFMFETEREGRLLLEPVYTAKAMMALRLYVEAGYFAAGTRLVFVHTGGLQGRRAALPRLNALLR
ncbi:pyridoxal-phosphate dependent enzyme [Pseudomonas sp. PS1]|uniref:Pyridoxal-phosphate dependent enzyme n=1 Tax=Stutzerimonas marianensis TaxID=2929513 RepID=A0A9X1W3X8_9GAMM|nr:pyridoxal-phosphate dependent enzyme [Pseudomonas marianensis]MCJ0974566.1 pyridoxal-phosphate dependent enzyme [Pseudomonas marianensis]